jgi:hypothetical protein
LKGWAVGRGPWAVTVKAKKQRTGEHSNVEQQNAEVKMRNFVSSFLTSTVRLFECSPVCCFFAFVVSSLLSLRPTGHGQRRTPFLRRFGLCCFAPRSSPLALRFFAAPEIGFPLKEIIGNFVSLSA